MPSVAAHGASTIGGQTRLATFAGSRIGDDRECDRLHGRVRQLRELCMRVEQACSGRCSPEECRMVHQAMGLTGAGYTGQGHYYACNGCGYIYAIGGAHCSPVCSPCCMCLAVAADCCSDIMPLQQVCCMSCLILSQHERQLHQCVLTALKGCQAHYHRQVHAC